MKRALALGFLFGLAALGTLLGGILLLGSIDHWDLEFDPLI